MRKVMSAVAGIAVTSLLCGPAVAGGASYHFSQALGHSMEALAQATVGGLKLVSGAAAVPLMLGGEIGKASGQAGHDLWKEADTPIGKPLVITDEVVTAGPAPSEAMKQPEEQQK